MPRVRSDARLGTSTTVVAALAWRAVSIASDPSDDDEVS
jgi:hypothetical protein